MVFVLICIEMNNTTEHTLKLLIEGCKTWDHAAQKGVYQLFSAKMFAICLRYAKDRMEAEEILQSGFVKVFRSIENFRNEGAFEGWVKRIMVNTAIEYYRRSSKLMVTSELTPQLEPQQDAGSALDKLALDDLLSLIAALPDGYRMVFNLYAVEGFSHKEIAAQLGITEGASKSQLSRARTALQNAIKKTKEVCYARL